MVVKRDTNRMAVNGSNTVRLLTGLNLMIFEWATNPMVLKWLRNK